MSFPHRFTPLRRLAGPLGGALLLLSLLFAAPAAAQSGHAGVSLGATFLGQGGDAAASVHPTLRAEVSFRMVGPLELGGFLVGTATELPFDGPALGGGLLLALRPHLPILGIQPHLEASIARLQLPSETQGRADAWGISLGGGLGVSIDDGLSIEAKVMRSMYQGPDPSAGIGDVSWTGTLGVLVDLP